jgi:hypothetical protein
MLEEYMNTNTDNDRIIGGNADAAGQPGPRATGTQGSFAAPLGTVTHGRLIFTNGAASLTLHAERGMPELYRATFARRIPHVWVQDGTVSIQYRRFSFLHWMAELREPLAQSILNGSIAWEIEETISKWGPNHRPGEGVSASHLRGRTRVVGRSPHFEMVSLPILEMN